MRRLHDFTAPPVSVFTCMTGGAGVLIGVLYLMVVYAFVDVTFETDGHTFVLSVSSVVLGVLMLMREHKRIQEIKAVGFRHYCETLDLPDLLSIRSNSAMTLRERDISAKVLASKDGCC